MTGGEGRGAEVRAEKRREETVAGGEGKGAEVRAGKRREESVGGGEGKGAEVRATEEEGGDCGWRGRGGSRGTC